MTDITAPEQSEKTRLGQMLQAKREVRKTKQQEESAAEKNGIKDSVWGQYGHNYPDKVLDYNISLEEALIPLGINSLQEYLVRRKAQGLTTNVLDLMGGNPSFLRDLKKQIGSSLDHGLSVGLADDREAEFVKSDREARIDAVSGDLMAKNTWERIDHWQKDNGVKHFDLIVSRGVDGNWLISPLLYPFIFEEVWKRLSERGGLFVTQLSKAVEMKDLREMDSQLSKKCPGMRHYVSEHKIWGHFPTVAIIRESQSTQR